MHPYLRPFRAALLLAVLLLPLPVFAQEGKALAQKGGAAYESKQYGEAATLFLAAAEAGYRKPNSLYNAACAFALAGRKEDAFRTLDASIDAGLGGQSPAQDPDFASLHADPRWQKLLDRYDAAHPEDKVAKTLGDQKIPVRHRYLAGRQAIAAGARVDETGAFFNQMYANVAQHVGEYDEASRIYGFTPAPDADPVGDGYTHAVDALPVVLAQAHGRQAVFLNESHGQSQTRAANYALLAGLRADGFDTLAMETLATTAAVARDGSHCSNTSMLDAGLPARGYAIDKSGYYTADPVYAEIVREALRLGFKLVAYDSDVPGGVPGREQNEAENLACVFKADPKARLVVVAGFSHIAEAPDFWVPGGAMAYRFRQLSGIDPLTVDTTTQLHLTPAQLSFDGGTAPVSYVLQDAQGKNYRTFNFDLVLHVPAPAHRNDGEPGWLALGGARKPTPVAVSECAGHAICFVEARRIGEAADAIAADACVLGAKDTGCALYLAAGRYELLAFDEQEKQIARRPLN